LEDGRWMIVLDTEKAIEKISGLNMVFPVNPSMPHFTIGTKSHMGNAKYGQYDVCAGELGMRRLWGDYTMPLASNMDVLLLNTEKEQAE